MQHRRIDQRQVAGLGQTRPRAIRQRKRKAYRREPVALEKIILGIQRQGSPRSRHPSDNRALCRHASGASFGTKFEGLEVSSSSPIMHRVISWDPLASSCRLARTINYGVITANHRPFPARQNQGIKQDPHEQSDHKLHSPDNPRQPIALPIMEEIHRRIPHRPPFLFITKSSIFLRKEPSLLASQTRFLRRALSGQPHYAGCPSLRIGLSNRFLADLLGEETLSMKPRPRFVPSGMLVSKGGFAWRQGRHISLSCRQDGEIFQHDSQIKTKARYA